MDMKNWLTVLTLSLAVSVAAQERTVVTVPEHAAPGCRDYTPVVRSILEKHPEGNLTLLFPKGEYHFSRTYARAKYHAVTNHDNGYKYFAFPLEGMRNVTVDGQGSEFIFHDVMTPFLVEGSENVLLTNFTIDWEEPFYIQGEVVTSDPEAGSMDLHLTDFSRTVMEGDRLVLTNNGQALPFLGETMVFDPRTGAVAYNAAKFLLGGVRTRTAEARRLPDGGYRITAGFAGRPAPVGMVYVFKGPNGSNRLAPAIHVKDSEGFTARHLVIHHAGGMGVIAEKSGDLHLDDVDVRLRPGSGRMVTTTADATHFCNCRGQVVIENCLFENMLDDATNVHGTYLKVERVVDDRTLIARLNHPQQFDYDFAAAGDEIRVVAARTLAPKGCNRVVSCRKLNEVYALVRFEEPVGPDVAAGDGLENMSWYPELTFRNNVVRNNRARSILLSSGRKMVVENNTFSSMMTSILFEGDLDHWHESGAVSDVVIRNNTFLDCCYGGNKASVIWINPHVEELPEGVFYERSIVIEGNRFRSFDRSVLNARSVDGLVFRNNVIEPSGTYSQLFPEMPEIRTEHVSGFVCTGNVHKGPAPAEVHLIDTAPALSDGPEPTNSNFKMINLNESNPKDE